MDGDRRKTPPPPPRRIKRRVAGPVHDFFAATSPGLEALCRRELSRPPLSVPDAAAVAGGVAFSGKLVDLYRANLHLRTANRILMRIASFPATNFRQLERRLAEVEWPLYLPGRAAVQVRVSCRHCRLYHSEAVAERVHRRIEDAIGPPSGPDCSVYVRCRDDRFDLSVDSSGELMFRRGIKTQAAAAPLRETLAAAILMWAGFAPEEALLDPMCGSGTFSIEGAMSAGRIPAGWYRHFAFESWPAFRPAQWAHLRKEAAGRIAGARQARIFAGDRDPAVLPPLKRSLCDAGLQETSALFAADFFDLRPGRLAAGPGLLVLNPPYGRRLKAESGAATDGDRIFGHMLRSCRGWKIAVLLPPDRIGRVPFRHEKRRLVHGGLRLTLVTGRIPSKG